MPRSALLVTYSLEMGGTQRASVFLAEVLASAGWRVSLFVCADRQRHVAPPASVVLLEGWRAKRRWRCLGLAGRSLGQAVALRRALRSERPDVIIALGNTPGLLALAATMGAAAPVVVADRVAPSQDTVERGLWRLAVRALYPRAARLVAPSQGILRERAWLADTAKVVIPNAVWLATDATSDGVALAPADAPHVVALGRLHPQKGFDLLVQAFAQLATKHPGWHLTIFGEGPERNRLEALAAGFGLRSRVHLPGAIRAPAAVLHRAAQLGGIFAFPSRYEGFPNALIEAIACGLPVVAADCPHGPREILGNGEHGLLVPPEDASALAAALASLMDDARKRTDFAARASARAKDFDPSRIGRLWLDLLEQVVAQHSHRSG